MIIVRLMGGLGNQMFQYALGRKLALKHGVSLKLDTTFLVKPAGSGFTMRDLELDVFNVQAELANDEELKRYDKSKAGKIFDYLLLKMPFTINRLYVREPQFNFYAKALSAPADSYLDGYWQSEKYFIDIRNELLNEFSLTTPLTGKNRTLSEQMANENSVSIHVRRGDYLIGAANQNLFEICDENYYSMAMDHIAEKTGKTKYYVFSDDPRWFRENVRTPHEVEFVEGNPGKDSYIDLFLMSQCKHNIIANSSFSWWGAWLNQSDKTVIAPEKWFRYNAKNTDDLIPANWLKL